MRVYLRDRSQTIFTCCHTETEVADPTFHLTQSQCTDTGSTSPSADPAPGRAATGVPIFKSLVWLDPGKSRSKQDLNPGSSTLEADALTVRSMRQSKRGSTENIKTCQKLSKQNTSKPEYHINYTVLNSTMENSLKNFAWSPSLRS